MKEQELNCKKMREAKSANIFIVANHIWQQNYIEDKDALTNKMGGAYVILNHALAQKQIKSWYPTSASSFLPP